MIMRLGGLTVAQSVSTPKLPKAIGPYAPAIKLAGVPAGRPRQGASTLSAVGEIVGHGYFKAHSAIQSSSWIGIRTKAV
jgi:hypothetical protein